MKIHILPSLLAADLSRLGEEIRRAEVSGADELHLDIMDGVFVPNISYGPNIVKLARRIAPDFHRHVHLMLTRPDKYIEPFFAAGAQTIQAHVEADCDLHTTLKAIRAKGIRAGLVLNPETPVESIRSYYGEADEYLVMTVHPGYGGQSFIAECLPKVTELRRAMPEADIMIDGGANAETAVAAARAGANMIVAGSYLFKQPDMSVAVANLRGSCEAAFMKN